MSIVWVQREITHAPAAVWEVVADIGGIHRFHPAVARSPLTGSQERGVGAERTCHFHDGNHIDERVVAWEEGHSLEVDIVRGSFPLVRARARFVLEPVPTGTRVTMRMDYKPKFGPVGFVMDQLMMKRQFRGLMARILEGLETHLSTGQIIGPDGAAEAA
ncbi:MAG: SRPBCC family protein [Myxococcota bacterium]